MDKRRKWSWNVEDMRYQDVLWDLAWSQDYEHKLHSKQVKKTRFLWSQNLSATYQWFYDSQIQILDFIKEMTQEHPLEMKFREYRI